MDRRRAAAALLALAACIACSSAAPTANDQTALELMDGPTEGCYYNFQHYGEGDRIMTNEPCLNCTCHNRMLMCYLRVCPFTKPIGQDCTVEKRADQCCPIVTCPDVPVDLLTSTSTSSPAEYGTTGVGKLDKYGCSINGKYFSEGAKVPSTPNKPCEHCYCIRNMTTCVMQECTLHVDGCTPIYHKDVCCPVRYSCDHPEDEILLLDDMTTTVRPTPGFLLTTTTVMPVTQISQDCVHDNQIFPDGTLIKTEKACEHCYCMKGDIVCVVQECGTPMENEGKNCTSLPPRHGQCCPDTYICEGDDRGTELTTENVDQSTTPPRRVGIEGSGYRNEPDEPFTEMSPFETDIEGSGEDYTPISQVTKIEDVITEKTTPDIIDEILAATTEKVKIMQTTEPDKDQNTIPDIISDDDQPNIKEQTTEANVESATVNELKTTISDEYEPVHGSISKEDDFITTESAFRKEDNNIVADEIITVKEHEELPTTLVDLVDETTFKDEHLLEVSTDVNIHPEPQSTTPSIEMNTEDIDTIKQKEPTTLDESQSQSITTERIKPDNELPDSSEENVSVSITAVTTGKTDIPETTSVNPVINEIDHSIPIISAPGRIPGEGDCLLNGITYSNNTIVPSTNNCHTSCKCTSSIIKCDPIICSSPPEYMENMSDCQPIYDSPDACCPTYVCSAKETIPPQSHNQMSGTESPKPIVPGECSGQDCILDEEQKTISEPPSKCDTDDCLNKSSVKQEQGDCDSNNCGDQSQKPPVKQECSDNNCPVSPVVACEGDNCLTEPVSEIDSHKLPDSENTSQLICNENGECKKSEVACIGDICEKHEISETEVKAPSDCTGPDCITHEEPVLPPKEEQVLDFTTERIEKVTEISLTELDVNTEYPATSISPSIDDNLSENPTMEVVHEKETETTDKSITVSETLTNDNTESPTIQSITEKSEILINTEKSEMDTQPKDEFIKMTEPSSVEHDTEISELAGNEAKVTAVTETDRMTTESETIYHISSENTNKMFEDNVTDKTEITTDNNDIDATVPESVTEKEKTDSEIPKLTEIETEKSTTPVAHLDETDKEGTIEDVSEKYGIKDEKTTSPVPDDIITKVTEKASMELDEGTEINELPQTTSEPHKQIVEIEKGEVTEMPEIYKPQEEMTEDYIATTDTAKMSTENNMVSTEASQPMETKSDEVTKQTPQEIFTEKQETYTESSEHFTPESEQTSSEISKQDEHTLSTTQYKLEVTEQPILEEESTSAKESEVLVTKSDESTPDIVKLVTESGEIHAATTEQVIEGSDVTSISPITEIKTESAVTNKAFTETTESDSTEKQETITEAPKIHTISEESITKDNDDKDLKPIIVTELPTVISTLAEDIMPTIKITEEQEILTKETEKPMIAKDSSVSDDNSYTKSEAFETSTDEMSVGFTEKLDAAVTESSPEQNTENLMELTSSEPTKVDEPDYESHKVATTLKDDLLTQEVTTQEVIVVTEKQTKSPLESDEVTMTSMEEIIPSKTDENTIDTSTQKSSHEKDESHETTSAPITSQSELTTAQYENESQPDNTMKESQTPLDSSTIASELEDKQEDTTNLYVPKEETLTDVTTSSPKDKQEMEKDSSLFTESETTLQDMEKQQTTAGLVPGEEKETEPASHVTESLIDAKDEHTLDQTTAAIIDEEIYKTTEKSVGVEESLSPSTNEYSPEEDMAKETTLQSSYEVSTEKTNLLDTFETSSPINIDTTKSEVLTKFEESTTTETAVDIQEKERITELPESYITSKDLDSTPIVKEEEDNLPRTTPSSVQKEEKIVTKIPLVTDFDNEKETMIPEKHESEMDSTTEIYEDKKLETEKDQTITSDMYTTEPQIQTSENPKDKEYQHLGTSTEKIITTESTEYLMTSQVHETTLSSLGEDVKGEQQETVTENTVYETDIVTDSQPASPELEILNTEPTIVPTEEDETMNRNDEKTTVKSIEDFEKSTSHPPEYQATVSGSKEEMTTELTREEIITMPPKVSDQDKDDSEVTEIHPSTQQGPSTMYPEIHDHETITEKEKSTESFEAESHTITTVKSTLEEEEEKIEEDTPIHSSTDNNLTDRPTVSDTDSKVSDVVELEHKTTEIPVFTEINTLPDTKVVTEKQEKTETESITEKIETTETQILDQKDSSTEPSNERTKVDEETETDSQKLTTIISNDIETFTTPTFDTKHSQSTEVSYHTEPTTSIVDLDKNDELITSITEDASLNIETTKPAILEKEQPDQSDIYSTESVIELQTEVPVSQDEINKPVTEVYPTPLPNVKVTTESSSERHEEPVVTEDNKQSTDSESKFSETTSFLVELEEHTHSIVDEVTTRSSIEEIATTVNYESQQPERGDQIPEDFSTPKQEYETSEPTKTTEKELDDINKPVTNIPEEIDEIAETTNTPIKTEMSLLTEKLPTSTSSYESQETKKDTTVYDEKLITSTPQVIKESDITTESIEKQQTPSTTLPDVESSLDKDISSEKPSKPEIFEEKETTESTKDTTSKINEETSTYSPSHITKPTNKPIDTTLSPSMPEVPKPGFIDENEGIPSPDFPPSGGYGQEPDYIDEDQAFGPGTCRYGGKVYVSAQQIPRDDPCDFCFCFRSDIICLQQSCPPPIHGCHEEPIQGFCCPRYECPVSMATTLNVTTTTTTTTTTLPPHFLAHAYKGAAQRRGCQIKGHTYKVGEVVRASSGPCLHCTCGGDGQMKCDPKACTPEPMLRQMIAAAVSAKRRR